VFGKWYSGSELARTPMVGVAMAIFVDLLTLHGKLCRFGEKVSNVRLLSLDSFVWLPFIFHH
jgi:hypothetical protein